MKFICVRIFFISKRLNRMFNHPGFELSDVTSCLLIVRSLKILKAYRSSQCESVHPHEKFVISTVYI